MGLIPSSYYELVAYTEIRTKTFNFTAIPDKHLTRAINPFMRKGGIMEIFNGIKGRIDYWLERGELYKYLGNQGRQIFLDNPVLGVNLACELLEKAKTDKTELMMTLYVVYAEFFHGRRLEPRVPCLKQIHMGRTYHWWAFNFNIFACAFRYFDEVEFFHYSNVTEHSTLFMELLEKNPFAEVGLISKGFKDLSQPERFLYFKKIVIIYAELLESARDTIATMLASGLN